MTDCASCRHPCGAIGASWFSIGQIVFCRPQMLWLLENIVDFRAGGSPPDPQKSSAVDPGLRSQPRQSAPFEKPVQIASEVDIRLRMLPHTVRDLLEIEVERKQTLEKWREDAKIALDFISGFKRPIAFCPDCNGVTLLEKKGLEWTQKCEDCGKTWGHLSFVSWRKQRNFREKVRLMHICPKCGGYRWKTKVKDEVWTCRKCGFDNIKPKV